MVSRYSIFCKVIETGSFTKTAQLMGYTQSAVSQMIKNVEQEMETTLIIRKKDGIELTQDGKQYYPYFQAIVLAEKALEEKKLEMEGLYRSQIRIGTFTSVSRNLLPPLMKKFKEKYPDVGFVLRQGEYTSIAQWINEGDIDFGFLNLDLIQGIEYRPLFTDEMLAVLPKGHPLSDREILDFEDLVYDPLILLDEGEESVPLKAFEEHHIQPKVAYKVTDDYSIMAMINEGLGISMLYHLMLVGYEKSAVLKRVQNPPYRTLSLAWHNWDTMPLAARRFAEFIMENIPEYK